MPGWFKKNKPPKETAPKDLVRSRCLYQSKVNGRVTPQCSKKRGHGGKHSWEK